MDDILSFFKIRKINKTDSYWFWDKEKGYLYKNKQFPENLQHL